MNLQLVLNDLNIEVTQKRIKNVHLNVCPPNGHVKVSAPLNMSQDVIRAFVISKLGWIKKRREKFQSQIRETPREYIERESHYFLGERYLLKIIEHDGAPRIETSYKTMRMYIRPDTSMEKRSMIMNAWYRQQLKAVLPEIVQKYEKLLGVNVDEVCIKRMKTRWGSCNPKARRIWINLELAKKPSACLEYVVAHEVSHLVERTHNGDFISLMDRNLPDWRFVRDQLNSLPVV